MAAMTESGVEDLTDTCWRDDQWLQIFPLNTFTALDYFSFSPFFLRGCNNDIAKMQGLDLSKMGYALGHSALSKNYMQHTCFTNANYMTLLDSFL